MNENQVAISESTLGHGPQARQQHPGGQDRPDHALAPGHGAVQDGPRVHRDHGRARREVRLRLQRRRRDVRRLRPQRSLDLRNHARRPAVDARDRQARRGLVRPARPRRPRLGLPQRVPDRRDRPEQQGLLHGLAQRHLLRRREQALRSGLRASRSAGNGPIRRAEGSASSSQGRTPRLWRFFNIVAPSLKLNPETPNMDLPFSVKPDKKLSAPGRHEPHPGQVLRHALRPGQGHPRRPLPEPQLLRRDPQDQRGQRRIHQPRPVPARACRTTSAASSGCPSVPRTRPSTCPSTPA